MTRQDPKKKHRWWWGKMLVGSAGLAGLLGFLAWAAPALKCVGQAWAYRSRVESGEPLEGAVSYIEVKCVSVQRVTSLLGQPDGIGRAGPEGRYLLYLFNDFRSLGIVDSNLDFSVGLVLRFREGEPVAVMPLTYSDYRRFISLETVESMTPKLEFVDPECDGFTALQGLALQNSTGGMSYPPLFRPRR